MKISTQVKIKKIALALLIVMLAALLVVIEIIPSTATTRMPGIEKLVIDMTADPETNEYSVLEIVPDYKCGEIGYMTESGMGHYFDQYMIDAVRNELATVIDPDVPNLPLARENAYNELIADLQSKRICAPNDAEETSDYALYRTAIETYTETYFKSEAIGSQWYKFVLPEDIRETLITKGEFNEVAEGTGNYNVLYDTTGEKTIAGFRLAEEGEEGTYKITFDTYIRVSDNHPENLIYGGYSLVDINSTPEDLSDDIHVKTSVETDDLTLRYIYQAEEITEASNPEEFNYVPIYSFGYSENGNYDFNRLEGESIPVNNLEIGEIYYKQNITSNKWLKTEVFELEEGTDYFNNFNVSVTTLTAKELSEHVALNSEYLNEFELLYIAGCDNNTYKVEATEGNDINYDILKKIKTKVVNGEMAAIVDSKIFFENMFEDVSTPLTASINDSYVYKLAVVLMLDDIYLPSTEPTESEWSNDYASDFAVNTQTYFSSTNGNFIKGDIYCHGTYYSQASGALLDKEFNTAYDSEIGYDYSVAFEDMIGFITDENLIRTDSDKISTDISVCSAMQYVISVNTIERTNLKSELKILDIEPAKSDGLTKAEVKAWLPSFEYEDSEIEIVHMTSSEFIGKIEDLKEEYDLIYLGLDTGNLNTIDGETVYNDSNLNGKIYLHTGDVLFGDRRLEGMLDEGGEYGHDYYKDIFGDVWVNHTSDYAFSSRVINMDYNIGTMRFSGNDITKIKADELLEYVAAGYPLVLDGKFDGTNTNLTSYLDTASNMNYFYTNVSGVNSKENVFYKDTILPDDEVFKSYLVKPKLNLDLLNAEYLTYPNKINDGVLEYIFIIENDLEVSAETRYYVNLYFDLDVDGRYSESTEKQTQIEIKDSGGNTVVPNDEGVCLLKSNETYTLKRFLPDTYSGPISWKLYLGIYGGDGNDTVSDTTEIEPVDTDAKLKAVNVLQIKSDMQGILDTNKLDLAEILDDGMYWHEDLENHGYDIRVDSVYASEFNDNYQSYLGNTASSKYDILVIGFSDSWMEIDDLNAINSIKDFLDAGNSVLFTHDSISYINATEAKLPSDTIGTYWGYEFNEGLRNIFGMDRYGVAERTVDNSDFTAVAKTLREGNVIYNSETILSDAKDKAYVVDGLGVTYPEVRGFTNGLLDNCLLNSNYYSLDDEGIPINSELVKVDHILDLVYEDDTNYTSSNHQMYINQINSGQLTKFPYNLEIGDGTLDVAPTHFQYYQLDMESQDANGNSEIVVWYTIGGEKDENGIEVPSSYSASPNDIRNNYYIYSKGNVMYSGLGHSTIDYSDHDCDEFKLFLNTMIATYKMGAQTPELSLQNDSSINSGSRGAMCFAYDDASDTAEEAINGSSKIYYNIINPNLMATNSVMKVSYEYDNNGTYETLNAGTKIVTSEGDVSVTDGKLISGRVYYIDFYGDDKAYNYINSDDGLGKIRIKIDYTYTLYGETVEGSVQKDLLLTKMSLFNLQ